MQQRYYDGRTGQETQAPTNRPSEQGLLDQLVEKLKSLVGSAGSPIIPTGRSEQIGNQERAAESPDAPAPLPSPTPKPAAAKVTDKKPVKKHDGWVDGGYGSGALNAQGQQWQGTGAPPVPGGKPAPSLGGPPVPMPGSAPAPGPAPAPGGNPSQGAPPPPMPSGPGGKPAPSLGGPPVPQAGGGKPAPSLGGPPAPSPSPTMPPSPAGGKKPKASGTSVTAGHDGKKKK